MGWSPPHKRMKPKAGAAPNAREIRHREWVREKGCLVCGDPAQIHHVTGYADRIGRFARSHDLIVPLCAIHHQAVFDDASRPQSVERLTHRGFYQEWGIDLLAEAKRLRAESEALNG